jgi:hypothetical protein
LASRGSCPRWSRSTSSISARIRMRNCGKRRERGEHWSAGRVGTGMHCHATGLTSTLDQGYTHNSAWSHSDTGIAWLSAHSCSSAPRLPECLGVPLSRWCAW